MLNWKKLILYPAAIYAVIFLFISALIGFKIDANAGWVGIVTTIINLVGLYLAARAADIKDLKKAIILGISWVLVLVFLDFILTVPFTGMTYFASWKTYLNYVFVLAMPIIFFRLVK